MVYYNRGLAWFIITKAQLCVHVFQGLGGKRHWEFSSKVNFLQTTPNFAWSLFRYLKQCPIVFLLKFASFSRYCVCKKPLRFSKQCFFFGITLFLKNKEQGSEKKLQSNVSQVKQSPLVKIQLFLSTFKNGEKSWGRSCLWHFNCSLTLLKIMNTSGLNKRSHELQL